MGVVEANPWVVLALMGNGRQTTTVTYVGGCKGPVTNVV
jgi:hypothetical protein